MAILRYRRYSDPTLWRKLGMRILVKMLAPIVHRIVMRTPYVHGGSDQNRFIVARTALPQNALVNLRSGSVTLEDYAFLGHNVALLTGMHSYWETRQARIRSVPWSGRDIVVREGAWIATNSTIIGPCEVGCDAVVAAGSVVVDDVPDRAIVAGSPARVVGTIDDSRRDVPAAGPVDGSCV